MRWWLIISLAAACGDGGEAPVDAGGGGGADAAGNARSCPPGEFATAVTEAGVLQCEPIDAAAIEAIAAHCSVYLGWQDSCSGCGTLPTKWGRVSLDSCESGAGDGNTCANTDLGGVVLPMFGLDLDGTVNDDDTFYAALECTPPADDPVPGRPCPVGSFLSSFSEAGTECVTAHAAIVEYLSAGCVVYHGWRDQCDGCASAPDKWGRTGSVGCTVEAGADSECNSFSLGGAPVFALGINTDGDVDDNDTFSLGFRCTGAVPAETSRAETCPPGQLVVGLDDAGVRCASPVPQVEAAVQNRCVLYYGWRDECDGCNEPPTKWGRVGHAACENGVGDDNTCASTPLDGTSVQLFGLNLDGTGDDNDKLYVGMACP